MELESKGFNIVQFTKRIFATQLIQKLNEGPYDILKISNWCNRIYFDHLREMDDDLYHLVFELSTMDDDPQFECSEQEIRMLAEKLINEEIDPKKLDDLHSGSEK